MAVSCNPGNSNPEQTNLRRLEILLTFVTGESVQTLGGLKETNPWLLLTSQ
jgi:hypothetical protein